MIPKKDKIPVTIITGFLGSGKTSLLNFLIAENPGRKFAIIENEFGDIAIDQDLVVNAENGIFELTNGCICCSLNVELGKLLQRLIEGHYHFDHLIIETTGIAEPYGIAAAFLGEGKGTRFQLDATICLADALHVEENLEERGEAVKQITFADVILMNKTDLVNEKSLKKTREILRRFNPDAKIVESEYGRAPLAGILDINAYKGKQLEKTLYRLDSSHNYDAMVAHSFHFGEPLDHSKFKHWIQMLLFLSGYQIYRVKGLLNFEGSAERMIFQSVRSSIQMETGSHWKAGEKRVSKIVFIGYSVKKEPIEKGLKGCIYSS